MRHFCTFTVLLALVSPVIGQAPQAQFTEIPGVQEFSGRLTAQPLSVAHHMTNGFTLMQAQDLHAQAGMLLDGYALREYVQETDEFVFFLPLGASENRTIQQLMAAGLFGYVEPDWVLYPTETVPNDPQFSSQWQHSKMKSTKAWDFHTGDGTFIACTVDTGVDLDHEDLQANLVSGYNSASRQTQANGGNVGDINGHGTNTLGCVGAIGNNNKGVVGMGWDLKLMPVRCTNSSGGGAYLSDLTDGARWASDNGARSVSVSYSGGNSSSVGSTGTHLRGEESLLCWSSGNGGNQVSGYDHTNVIVVGATNQNDSRTSWSTYGNWIDVVAPGDGVKTTANGGGYASVSGTSFSAPIVNGVLAMMMVASPDSSADDIEAMLFDNCVDLSSNGEDIYTGHGRPNFFKCMEAADGAGGGGSGLSLSGPSSATGGNNVTYSFINGTSAKPFGIYWSLSNAGTLYGGHQFDLGLPVNPVGTGQSSSTGSGYATKRIPSNVSNLTVYIEAMIDTGSGYEDSNMVTLTIL
jgi:hypothetical protein